MKKQLTVILFALILVMLLGAAPNVAPVTAALAAPPAVSPSEPAAQTPEQWCSNVHIVFFPGGPGRRLCRQRL